MSDFNSKFTFKVRYNIKQDHIRMSVKMQRTGIYKKATLTSEIFYIYYYRSLLLFWILFKIYFILCILSLDSYKIFTFLLLQLMWWLPSGWQLSWQLVAYSFPTLVGQGRELMRQKNFWVKIKDGEGKTFNQSKQKSITKKTPQVTEHNSPSDWRPASFQVTATYEPPAQPMPFYCWTQH